MKNRIQIVVILLILMNLHTSCQEQTKYDGEVNVEYTPQHVNLIRPIIEPEKIYQMSIEGKNFEMLPMPMKDMKNLRELELSRMNIKDWETSSEVINSFSKLEELEISALELNKLPFNPESLPKLKELDLIAAKGYSLDKEINKILQLKRLEFLCVGGLKTDHLPTELRNHNGLKRFHFGYHKENFDYEEAIEIVSQMPSLEHIQFDIVEFETIPDNIHKLDHLKKLGFYNGSFDISAMLRRVKKWKKLEMLEFKNMDIQTLPNEITEIKTLRTLKLHNNRNLDHQKLFRQLAELPHLEELVISKTILNEQHDRFVMPQELAELKNLKRLDMATSRNVVFDSLFNVLAKLPKLEKLDLYDCKTYLDKDWEFTTIPNYIHEFQNLKELNLKRTFINILRNVEKFPPSLEKLNFSQVGFGREGIFPPVILKTRSLISLNLNDCELKELPEEIGNLTNLVHLDLGNNQLRELPESITKLKKLRYLNLMGTYISESKEKRREIEQMLPNTLVFFGEYEAYEPL